MEEDINWLLLGALENVLGKGYRKARGNYAFMCPFCFHRKPKLEINLTVTPDGSNPWECWVCGTKGRTIRSLLKHLSISVEESAEILKYVRKGEEKEVIQSTVSVRLPDEYQLLSLAPRDSVEANRYRNYLYNRGLTDIDFLKYNIGYCTTGLFQNRVIVPSYSENNHLNYFTARSLDPEAYLKYLNPAVERDNIVAFENLINWNQSIILCEGMFDAIALKRNAIPLLGKQVSSALMKKIITNPVPEVYVCLDGDALKAALKHCETFLDMGMKVYLVRPESKDPSETGFEKITKQLQKARELTFVDLIKYKLEL